MTERKSESAADDYSAISRRMKEIAGGPLPNTPRKIPPGFERWVRETSNGNLDMEYKRLVEAGVLAC